MGNCGSANNNKQTHVKTNQIKNKVNSEHQNIDNKNPTNSKLKSVPPKIDEQKNKIKVKCSINNSENNEDLLNSSFDENILLKDIISQINYDKNKDYDILNNNNEKLNDKLDMKIKDIFPNSNIELNLKYSGLEISEDIKTAYSQNNKLIGSLILDNPDYVGIFILNTSTEQTSNYIYLNDNPLRKFNSFTAFCNGRNNIFLSGGKHQNKGINNNELFNDFYMIDLENVTQNNIPMTQLTNLIEARTWHSMIYIPNKYIFIVGGIKNKSVELYDIDNKTIKKDSELNEARSECSLCLVNNYYLYAFCGFLFNQFFINTIERCNLRREKRKWKIVNYSVENNIKFNPSFFGVCYFNDKIILLGGNEVKEEKNKNYIVSIGDNQKDDIINEYKLNENFINVYREKFFIPINDKISINIPLISNNPIIFYFDNENGTITKKDYQRFYMQIQ
jgi:hypothetical protein